MLKAAKKTIRHICKPLGLITQRSTGRITQTAIWPLFHLNMQSGLNIRRRAHCYFPHNKNNHSTKKGLQQNLIAESFYYTPLMEQQTQHCHTTVVHLFPPLHTSSCAVRNKKKKGLEGISVIVWPMNKLDCFTDNEGDTQQLTRFQGNSSIYFLFFLSSRLHSNLYLFCLIVLTKRSEVKLCSVRAFRIIVLISLSTEAKQEQPIQKKHRPVTVLCDFIQQTWYYTCIFTNPL